MLNVNELDPKSCAEMARTCACLGFRKASRSVTQLYDQFLAPSGLRSTQLVVLLSAYVLGSSNLRRLADELAMDRSTLTRNLKPLIVQRLLRTVPGKGRGRSKSIEVTLRGQDKLRTAAPLWQLAQESLRERLGDDRLSRVLGDLEVVTESVRKSQI
ncbi:MAG TPA: MarR family winged helix-turn-helix transcriptional regulator [Pirellulales bacterium]|jgi:DNA-binding MarR family transcriptional regulator|nr:MarR family winged helix-turn-helix transcriptional regulator [Pirellulales bacterium]